MTTKTLADKTAEIVENNTRLGWYVNCATFPEAMALLHSEVSEAVEAWRVHGLKSWKVRKLDSHTTCQFCLTREDMNMFEECPTHLDKPEGVGSEFADVLIRLLDDAWLFGKLDLDEALAACHGRFGIDESFMVNMNTLHVMIAKASMAHGSNDWQDEEGTRGGWTWRKQFTAVLVFLRQLSEHYGIDLEAEYERKAAYNRTRPYRHGGKSI
jgi:hypothetical protein